MCSTEYVLMWPQHGHEAHTIVSHFFISWRRITPLFNVFVGKNMTFKHGFHGSVLRMRETKHLAPHRH